MTPQSHKYRAQVIVSVRIIRLDGDCLCYQVHGLFVFAGSLDDGAEQAQRDGMPWVGGQKPPVDFLGLEQPPGAVVVDGFVQAFRQKTIPRPDRGRRFCCCPDRGS